MLSIFFDRLFPLILLTIVACALGGCQKPALDAAEVDQLSRLNYPIDSEYGDDIDVIVVPAQDTIRLANRTPYAYNNVQVWLNRQYVSEVGRVEIGTGNVLPLARFVNYYQEPFPRGSFLRPRRGEKIVLAEIYDPDSQRRHRMVVQPEYPKSLFNPLD